MTTEFERRRREEALRRARRRALLVTAAVAPPALAVAAAFSPLLDVDTVRVAGTARADVARAAAAAAHGHPLATVDTAAVRRDVLALR
ncbi:MAG TPA: hypothetical protein VFQ85_14790, partial [Mycobacteriales bacterium]|nr:hypothetical protein [Mycobacteriales bacterium]